MSKKTIYDKNLKMIRPEINLSTYSFLLSEIIQHFLEKKISTEEIEIELEKLGENIGPRVLELISFREKSYKHEIKHVEMLKFIHSNVWKLLFGRNADSLEKAKDSEGEYMIKDYNLPFIKYISEQRFSLASLMCGILKSILVCAGFDCKLNYYLTEEGSEKKTLVVFIIEFSKDVLKKENI